MAKATGKSTGARKGAAKSTPAKAAKRTSAAKKAVTKKAVPAKKQGRGRRRRPEARGQEGPREGGEEGREARGQEGAGEEGPREEGARQARRPRRPRKPAVKKTAPAKAKPAPKPKKQPAGKTCPLSGIFVPKQSASLSPKTLQKLRDLLIEERARHLQQSVELQADADMLVNEREQGDTQFDEESGEGDTISVERERDLMLSANARQAVDEIDRALERMDNGSYGLCVPAAARSTSPGSRPSRGPSSASTASSVSSGPGARPPAAPPRWLAPTIVVGILVLDQLTKSWVVATLIRQPAVDHRRRRRAPPHPEQRRRVQPVHERDRRAGDPRDRPLDLPRARGAPGARTGSTRRSRCRWSSAARSGTSPTASCAAPGSCAVTSSTSSRSARSRRSTSPTPRSRSGRSSWSSPRSARARARPTSTRREMSASGADAPEPLAVPATLAGERVDRAVALLTGWSRAEVQDLVEREQVLVDGRAVAKSRRLVEGEVVEVLERAAAGRACRSPRRSRSSSCTRTRTSSSSTSPPGSSCTPAPVTPTARSSTACSRATRRSRRSATRRGRASCTGSTRDTSGLLVVARSAPAYDALVAALGARTVDAWLPRAGVGRPRGRGAGSSTRRSAVPSAARRAWRSAKAAGRARTRYEVDQAFHASGVSLLRCQLETGRTHQIRVHLAAIGHPVVGDAAYSGIRAGDQARPPVPPRRVARLHAADVRGGARVHVRAPARAHRRAGRAPDLRRETTPGSVAPGRPYGGCAVVGARPTRAGRRSQPRLWAGRPQMKSGRRARCGCFPLAATTVRSPRMSS